jgi:branched-chain amino acid transport system substrate-binding protein
MFLKTFPKEKKMTWSRISKLFFFLFLFQIVLSAQENEKVAENSYNIVVLLPFSDNGKPLPDRRSFQVLEGIKFAVHLHNSNTDKKIGLYIRDTRSDSSTIVRIRKEVSAYKNLIGIIGSTSSSDSRNVISVFADMNIPIIAPTATDEALTQLAPVVIQANPAFSTRGKIMANFAKNFHGLTRLGIVYSKEGYSSLLAESFKEEFERLGGKVILYLPINYKEPNFTAIIDKIAQSDSKIDGLYFPVSDIRQANTLNEKLRDLTFTKNVYGNQDWLLSDVFGDPAPFLSSIYVDSDYFIDMTQGEYQNLNKVFYELTGFLLDRNALYGFDATSMFISAISKSGFDPLNFLSQIQNGIDFDGQKNKIVLDNRRTNLSVNILQFNFGKFNLFLKLKI